MKPSSVTRMLTMIFLKVFSNLCIKVLLAICKYRHSPLPKQPSKIGNVLGLTFAARVFTTTSTPTSRLIEKHFYHGMRYSPCLVKSLHCFHRTAGFILVAKTGRTPLTNTHGFLILTYSNRSLSFVGCHFLISMHLRDVTAFSAFK